MPQLILNQAMAENIPNLPTGPAGAVPPPKKETGKVQPKKETVRINLPPKPSAAPTIKLPTLPPGGPTGVPTMTPVSAAAPAAAPAPPRTGAAAPALQRAAAPVAAAQAPVRTVVAAPAVATLNPMDKILALVAAVAGLIAVGTTVWLAFLF
jgi:hypothetical protein